MNRMIAAFTISLCLISLPAFAAGIVSTVDASSLARKKITPLGLYLSPEDAHAALKADADIVFIDVRDPIEVGFVGHAVGTDAIVPLALATHAFNPEGGRYTMSPNRRFLAEVQAVIARHGGKRETPVFFICRSGGRSAMAVRMLAGAGYTQVWNLVEGFEGDRDTASGARSLNGWRNAGLPWSYRINAKAAWQPEQ